MFVGTVGQLRKKVILPVLVSKQTQNMSRRQRWMTKYPLTDSQLVAFGGKKSLQRRLTILGISSIGFRQVLRDRLHNYIKTQPNYVPPPQQPPILILSGRPPPSKVKASRTKPISESSIAYLQAMEKKKRHEQLKQQQKELQKHKKKKRPPKEGKEETPIPTNLPDVKVYGTSKMTAQSLKKIRIDD